MGDRSNIRFKQSTGDSIYFYSHAAGNFLAIALVPALEAARGRWHMEPYATRIAIQKTLEVAGAESDCETGFGISTGSVCDNQHNLLEVDFSAKKVRLIDASHVFWGGPLIEKQNTVIKEWTFDDYILDEGQEAQTLM